MRLFTITTLNKDVLYSNTSPSNIRSFLEEWKTRKPNELLLIYSLSTCKFAYAESYLEVDDVLVYRAMFSPTIENVVVEGKHLDVVIKAVQEMEIITSDMLEYETLLLRALEPGLITTSRILKDARRRQDKFVKLLTGRCDDCDDDEDCDDDD